MTTTTRKELNTRTGRAFLRDALIHEGWTEDKWRHFHKEIEGRKYRVKFQANSARIEVRSAGGSYWTKSTGEYFGKLVIIGDEIKVGRMTFKLPPTK